MNMFNFKLLASLLAFFALVFLSMWMYEPLRVWYYVNVYRSETDARERIRIVDILCESERGKKALYKAFRERCISEMVKIPGGSFMMGSEKGELDEKAVHEVRLSGFWMDKYEVTNEKYYVFIKLSGHEMPGYFKNKEVFNLLEPVIIISWFDAQAYANWLGMRIPSEAEWEYACKAGSNSCYCFGEDIKKLVDYAWYMSNSGFQIVHGASCAPCIHEVGKKKPNNWGLYDMHGNVSEWCEDLYEDILGDEFFGKARVVRGGSWKSGSENCSAIYRGWWYEKPKNNFIGFRVCLSVKE